MAKFPSPEQLSRKRTCKDQDPAAKDAYVYESDIWKNDMGLA